MWCDHELQIKRRARSPSRLSSNLVRTHQPYPPETFSARPARGYRAVEPEVTGLDPDRSSAEAEVVLEEAASAMDDALHSEGQVVLALSQRRCRELLAGVAEYPDRRRVTLNGRNRCSISHECQR